MAGCTRYAVPAVVRETPTEAISATAMRHLYGQKYLALRFNKYILLSLELFEAVILLSILVPYAFKEKSTILAG